MPTHVARYARGPGSSLAPEGHLTLVTDQTRDAVFLNGRVRCGTAFARAMLVLGQIVKSSARATAKDHSAYQEWVQGQYLKELGALQAERIQGLPKLQKSEQELARKIEALQKSIHEAAETIDDWTDVRKFYDWLYTHNRDAWIQIDPVVSVQDDATFFEGFSLDESIYGRVRLAHHLIDTEREISRGTTNIDFGVALEREFARIRSYRPLELTVGADSVQIETDIGSVVEKKIDLPDSWVQGLVEVQSALMLVPETLNLNPTFVAEIISELEAQRERHGPRSLRFRLTPNERISVELEPWGIVLTDHRSRYEGAAPQEIRIWGRRRLLILKDILPDASTVQVRLLGSGMPSYWTVNLEEIELTIGLSGWTSLDWTGRARFGSLMPTAGVTDQLLTRAAALLKSAGRLTPNQLGASADVLETLARGALQKLCLAGKAMYDPDTASFRWRELYPEIDLTKLSPPALEERRGIELHVGGAVGICEETNLDGVRRRQATVVDGTDRATVLETDVDGRVTYAECTCPHFRHNKLRQGPCRHIVALSLK